MLDLTAVLKCAFPTAEALPWSTPTNAYVRHTPLGKGTVTLTLDAADSYTAAFEPGDGSGDLVCTADSPEDAVFGLFHRAEARLQGAIVALVGHSFRAWTRMVSE
jgi:hypothetical protein